VKVRSRCGIGALIAVLAALLLTAPAAHAAAGVSSALDGTDPTWHRPLEGTPPTATVPPGSGSATRYEMIPLTVDVTGTYVTTMAADELSGEADPFLCIYANHFSSASALSDAITCTGDSAPSLTLTASAALTAGTPYCVVATSRFFNEQFTYTVDVSGPGTPSLGPVGALCAGVSGALDGTDATWHRPLDGTPPTATVPPGSGSATRYDTIPLTVGVTGTYRTTMAADALSGEADPFLCIYASPFAPASPLSNVITCTGDDAPSLTLMATAALSAGTPYCVVATSRFFNEQFTYSVDVSGPGSASLGPVGGPCTAAPPAGGAPVCTKVKTDWRAPYKDGSCPDGMALHQIATTTGGDLTVCAKVKEDWRAPDGAGCPTGFTTLRVVTTPAGGLPVCVHPDIDWRDPYKDGTCPAGMALHRVVESGAQAT
jgi:hypothetical protein